MPAARSPQPQRSQEDPVSLIRLGGWFFRKRTALAILPALALMLVPAGDAAQSSSLAAAGVATVGLGEFIRIWAVRHIGAISRTRSDRLGPLVTTGPFALVRNPLYLGNITLWVGFALSARLVWMAPLILVVLGFEYHAIVRWEEQLLEARRGVEYRDYAARVPRWIPALRLPPAVPPATPYSWRDTFFSERGTLIAVAVGFVLLCVKTHWTLEIGN